MDLSMQFMTAILWAFTGITAHRIPPDNVLLRTYSQEPDITPLRAWQPTRKFQNAYHTDDRNSDSFDARNGCFPNILRKPTKTNLLKKLGRHYGYRYLAEPTANPTQIYNAEFTYSFVPNGAVFLPDSSIEAVHCVRNYNAVALTEAEYPQCISEHSDILSTPAGVDYHLTFSNEDVAPEYKVWYHLYDDPSPIGLEILFTCTEPNYITGFCRTPALVANTAVHPGRMSYRTKREIDELINQVLFPFCMISHDLLPVLFRPEYPACDTTPNPAFVQLVRGMTRSLHRRGSARYHRIHGPTNGLTTGNDVSLTTRPNPRPSSFQPGIPYPPAHTNTSWRIDGSSHGLSKVPTVHYPSEGRQASSNRNNSPSPDYRVVYQAPVYSEIYSPDNKTFLGFGKIPVQPIRPSNNHGDHRPHNEIFPGRNTLASTYRLPANLRYDDNETLFGAEEVPGSPHPPISQNAHYGNPSEVTGPDRVSSRVSTSENSEDYPEDNSLYLSRTRVSDLYDPNEYPEHKPRDNGTLRRNATMSRPHSHPKSPDDRSGNSSLLTGDKVSRPGVHPEDPADYPEGKRLIHSSPTVTDSYDPNEYPEHNRWSNGTLDHSRKVSAPGPSRTTGISGDRYKNSSAPIASGSSVNVPEHVEDYPEDNALFQTTTRVSDSYDPNDYPEHTPRGNGTLRGFGNTTLARPYSSRKSPSGHNENNSAPANSYNSSRPMISLENAEEYPEGRTLRHNSTLGTEDSYDLSEYPGSERPGNGTLRRPDQKPIHSPRTVAKDPYSNSSALIGAIGVSSSLYQLVRSEDYPEGNNLLYSTSRISDPYDPDEYAERDHRSNGTLLHGPYSSAGQTTDRYEGSSVSSDLRRGTIQSYPTTDNKKISDVDGSPLPDSLPEVRDDRRSNNTVRIPEPHSPLRYDNSSALSESTEVRVSPALSKGREEDEYPDGDADDLPASRSLNPAKNSVNHYGNANSALSESSDPHVSKVRDAADYPEVGDNDLAGSEG